MRKTTAFLIIVGSICVLACGAGAEPESNQAAEPAPKEAGPLPALLDRPFTAEEIRDEWIEGFRLRVRQWTPNAEVIEVWTVVRADADTVDIESMAEGEDGSPASEARVQTSSWVQLRDHASFPADRGSRENVRRGTPLGELQGWLYTIKDARSGTVTEFFFAETLPGAPVFVHVMKNGEVVEIFEQIERFRPE